MNGHRRIKLLWFALPLVAGLLGFFFVDVYVERAFRKQIDSFNRQSAFNITYRDFRAASFRGSGVLEGFRCTFARELPGSYPHLTMGRIELDNLDVWSLLFRSKLEIGALLVDDLDILVKPLDEMVGDRAEGMQADREDHSDNKQTDAFNKFKLDRFQIRSFQLTVMDSSGTDTLRYLKGGRFELKGMHIVADPGNQLGYRYINDKVELSLENESLYSARNEQEFTLNSFHYSFAEKQATATGLTLRNLPDLATSLTRSRYTTTGIESEIDTIIAYGFEVQQPWDLSKWKMDSLIIRSPQLTLLKDQRKPFDRRKQVPLIPDMLRKSTQDFYIGKIGMYNGQLDYTEIYELGPMHVPLHNLNLEIENIHNSLKSDKESALLMQLSTILFEDLDFRISLKYDDPLESHRFSFEGSTGPTAMRNFSEVLRHSAGLTLSEGRLDGIRFSGWGNRYSSGGRLTMRYHGLKAQLLKENQAEENRTLSILANSLLRNANPKRGHTKVAEMRFDRVPYKGFGNYLFKTIESGLLNTFNPFGGNAR